MNSKAQEALDKMLDLFREGDVPEALSITLLPRIDVPATRWSFNNRLLMVLAGTDDARGIRQWREVGRWPKKGSKAFYIVCPKTIQKKKDDGEKESIITGFKPTPVFRIEDTDGKEIKIEHFPPKQLPPLYGVAEQWGLSVDWQGYPGESHGYFSPKRREIVLATHDEQIFFHELGHAAHERLAGSLRELPIWRKEAVAELTAGVLGYLYGKRCNTGSHYRYIDEYAQSVGMNVYQACMAVVTDVGKCVEMIIETEEAQIAA